MIGWAQASAGGVTIIVRVVPRASHSEVQGTQGDALKVRLQAPPVEGKANRALVEFLAERLDVAKSQISIVSGDTGRIKRVRIQGVTLERVAGLITGVIES